MLDFKNIEISDKEIINSFFGKKNYFLCEYSFTDLFIWRNHYQTMFAVDDGFIFVKMTGENGKDYFFSPIGEGDFSVALSKLKEYTDSNNIPLLLTSVPPEYKEKIEQAMPDYFEFGEDRNNADYIYSAESLISLKGKKLHGKRNHINKFLQTHDNWSYEPLDDENTKEVFSYHLDWCDVNEGNFLGETCAVSVALKNREALGIIGGVLRLDGKIIAITMGSESFDDTFIVHIEKADSTIQGAYQMINQQFAQHNYEKYKWIDREEDLGIEGLRKAKLSYYPEFVAENYFGVPK